MARPRERLKRLLAAIPDPGPALGATVLIFHRVGGGSTDELDCPTARFAAVLDALDGHDVVSLDAALDRLDRGDTTPSVCLTFDDGWGDVHANAFPLLQRRGLPFTIYLASAYMGAPMRWEGSTGTGSGPGLAWSSLAEMVASGLCTIGNHTHTHARPEALTAAELDRCSDTVEAHLGTRPHHFAYTWGIDVPALHDDLRRRFRSAATGALGRNLPGTDRMALRRVPVRASDPPAFVRATLAGGSLQAERAYEAIVRAAKAARPRKPRHTPRA